MTLDERYEVRKATGYSLNTIQAWDLGKPVSVSTYRTISAAVSKLGYARKCDKGRKAKVVKVRC